MVFSKKPAEVKAFHKSFHIEPFLIQTRYSIQVALQYIVLTVASTGRYDKSTTVYSVKSRSMYVSLLQIVSLQALVMI